MSITLRVLSAVLAFSAVLSPVLLAQPHGAMYHFPQWSPDGRWILVSATLDGDSELYLLSPDGAAPTKLTNNSARDDIAYWIDGGKRILFTTDRRGRDEWFTMNADGTDPRPTKYDPDVTSTSPDGRTQLLEHDGVIFAVDVASKRRTAVSHGLRAEQGTYSPDGRWIAFEQRTAADPQRVDLSVIVVARANGDDARVVSPGTDPSWSPDGCLLIFKRRDARGERVVTTARPDGAYVRELAPGVHPHWSPDSKRIAFMRPTANGSDIWIMSADGSGQRCLTCAR